MQVEAQEAEVEAQWLSKEHVSELVDGIRERISQELLPHLEATALQIEGAVVEHTKNVTEGLEKVLESVTKAFPEAPRLNPVVAPKRGGGNQPQVNRVQARGRGRMGPTRGAIGARGGRGSVGGRGINLKPTYRPRARIIPDHITHISRVISFYRGFAQGAMTPTILRNSAPTPSI